MHCQVALAFRLAAGSVIRCEELMDEDIEPDRAETDTLHKVIFYPEPW